MKVHYRVILLLLFALILLKGSSVAGQELSRITTDADSIWETTAVIMARELEEEPRIVVSGADSRWDISTVQVSHELELSARVVISRANLSSQIQLTFPEKFMLSSAPQESRIILRGADKNRAISLIFPAEHFEAGTTSVPEPTSTAEIQPTTIVEPTEPAAVETEIATSTPTEPEIQPTTIVEPTEPAAVETEVVTSTPTEPAAVETEVATSTPTEPEVLPTETTEILQPTTSPTEVLPPTEVPPTEVPPTEVPPTEVPLTKEATSSPIDSTIAAAIIGLIATVIGVVLTHHLNSRSTNN